MKRELRRVARVQFRVPEGQIRRARQLLNLDVAVDPFEEGR